MATTPEKKVKDKVRAIVEGAKGVATLTVQNGMGTNGTSDFLCCVDGRFLAIETKAGNGKPTELQKHYLSRVHAAGGIALVINEELLPQLAVAISHVGTRAEALASLMSLNRATYGW